MDLEKVIADLVQKIERRFYGKYRGLVVENDDPEKLGRLKVKVPSVLGNNVVTGWALPCTPYGGDAERGFLFIPDIGAGVWMEFEEGDPEFPIWVGTFWSKPGGDSELPKPNSPEGTVEDDVQSPPTRKIIKTTAGHTIQFEDDKDAAEIVLFDGVNQHIVAMTKDGVTIKDGVNEHTFIMNGEGISITDGRNDGNVISFTADGIKIESKQSVTVNGQNITADAQGDIALTAQGKLSMDATAEMNLTTQGKLSETGSTIHLNP